MNSRTVDTTGCDLFSKQGTKPVKITKQKQHEHKYPGHENFKVGKLYLHCNIPRHSHHEEVVGNYEPFEVERLSFLHEARREADEEEINDDDEKNFQEIVHQKPPVRPLVCRRKNIQFKQG